MTQAETNTDIAVIQPRNAKGGNAKFSDKLNEQIRTAASYAVGAFRNFKENWDIIKETAEEEGVSVEECEIEYRYQIRGKLTKDQIYYLFHSEERRFSEQQRRLEQKQLLETAEKMVKSEQYGDENNRHVAKFDDSNSKFEDSQSSESAYAQPQNTKLSYNDNSDRLQILSQLKNESAAQRYGRKEYEALRIENEKFIAENAELKKKLEDVITTGFLVYLAENTESNEELGSKVRTQVKEDPRYKAHVKKEKAKLKGKVNLRIKN